MRNLIFIVAIALNLNAFGQLANGSTAPDFTLTDYYGNTHNLYSYLDSGKTVFLKIFAAHCPSCWAYHQTHRLKNMYNLYGPDGTDEIMILALEHDEYNDSNAFMGNGDPWVTQGNWLDGTPYPIFDVEGWPDRGVFSDYNVTFYPVIYKICPDKKVERINTSTTEAQLYQKVQACQILSINEEEINGHVFIDQASRKIFLEFPDQIHSVSLYNINGQKVSALTSDANTVIDASGLARGMYVLELKTKTGAIIEKIVIQ